MCWPLSVVISLYGHTVLGEEVIQVELSTPPVMISGLTGDLILAHHQIAHPAFFNVSPDVRLAAISRIGYKDCETAGKLAYTDIWQEWPGLQEHLPNK